MPATDPPAVLLDVDGTLIDSNYQHALAWYRAFRERGRTYPITRLHRCIGMGADQLVESVAGEAFDAEHGDAARDAEKLRFEELSGDLSPLESAKDLIVALTGRGCDVVLASSGSQKDVDRSLKLLETEELKHTSSSDVEASKPEPDLVLAALEQIDGDRRAVFVGDSRWDCEAAARAGIGCVAVLTGGAFSADELREAGAERVYADLPELLSDLDAALAVGAEDGSSRT